MPLEPLTIPARQILESQPPRAAFAPLDTITIRLTVGWRYLKVKEVTARDGKGSKTVDETRQIMARRVWHLYQKSQPLSTWQDAGIQRKALLGDLDITGILEETTNSKPATHHMPIVVQAGEYLEWEIEGDPTDFIVIVTGDPHVRGLNNPPQDGRNLFARNFEPCENGNSVRLGPALGAKYAFFKYHVILLKSPWATYDPDIICGIP